MSMQASAAQLRGMTVIDNGKIPIGTIEEVYLDGEDGTAKWGLVGTGPLGKSKRFVPLKSANLTYEGPNLRVAMPIDKKAVKTAPSIEAGDELAPEQERRLLGHYGLGPFPDSGGAHRAPHDAE
jgi:sporulation protein YlmC with PRC-barrel domain